MSAFPPGIVGSEPLEIQLKRAVEAYKAMSPVDRALHDADQRRSFVRGQCGSDPGEDVLAAEVRRLLASEAALRQALRQALRHLGKVLGSTETQRDREALGAWSAGSPLHSDQARLDYNARQAAPRILAVLEMAARLSQDGGAET